MKKVCFYGPESTGKSTMAKHFARIFKTTYVPEVAREMIANNDFSLHDIINIGHAQTSRVLELQRIANEILFCDSDVITTEIYAQRYLHTVPDILISLEKKVTYDRYFLFNIDVPWVPDHIRDLGDAREEMFDLFKSALEKRNISYVLVSGNFEERENIIIKELELLGVLPHGNTSA